MTEKSNVVEIKQEKRAVLLRPSRMSLAEHARRDWVIVAETGTTREDINDPQYFCHMAVQLRPYDRVEVRIDDESFLIEGFILACGRNWAKFKELRFTKLTADDKIEDKSDQFAYKYKGPHLKHCVIRLSDHEVIHEGAESKEAAVAWMKDYEKKVL